MKRLAVIALVFLVFASIPSAAKQDTVSEFRLERHVPKNWDAFVEINGVEKFVENFKKSATRKLADEALAKFKEQGGPDVLNEFEKQVGMSLADVTGLIKGQLAMGLQIAIMGGQGVNVVVTADCRTAENAQKLYDLISKRLEKAEAADLGGVRGLVGANGVTMAVDGPVVWVFNTNKIAAQFMGRRDKGAPKPIADEEAFTNARKTAGAVPGGIFAFVNVGKFAPLMGLIPDEKAKEAIERSGITGMKSYAASIRFEAGRVAQTHVITGGEKPTGFLGELLAMKAEAVTFASTPKDTAAAITLTKDFVGVAQKLLKMAIEANGGFHDENAEKAFEPLFREPKALGTRLLKAGGGYALTLDGTPAVEVIENLLDFTPLMGVTVKETEVDGATITELQLTDEQSKQFPLKVVGVSNEHAYIGFDKEPVAAAHKAIKASGASAGDDAEVKALLDGVNAQGSATIYIDFSQLPGLVESVASKFPDNPKASGPEMAVLKSLAPLAGRSLDWIDVRDGAVILESRSTSGLAPATLILMLPAAGGIQKQGEPTTRPKSASPTPPPEPATPPKNP